jgi:hypothetical protein
MAGGNRNDFGGSEFRELQPIGVASPVKDGRSNLCLVGEETDLPY